MLANRCLSLKLFNMEYWKEKDLDKISVGKQATVGDALRTLATHKPGKTGLPSGIVLCVDAGKTLLGIVTNGDMNRALARGVSMETPIEHILNEDPFVVVNPASNKEIFKSVVNKLSEEELHKDRLNRIVVIDEKRRVKNVAHFFDIWRSDDVDPASEEIYRQL